MPKSRDSIHLSTNSIEQLANDLIFILQIFSDRLDAFEGIRGELKTDSTSTFDGDITVNKDLIVNDSDGKKIHSLE